MNEDNDLELVDLGDACEETRQYSPWPIWVDSVFGWGEWGWG